ncbi:DNA ligase [Dirofilaria immitis]
MGSISQFESEIEIYAIRKGVGASPDERFSKAATRVDGFIGEDVTRNVATIKGFPKFLQGVRGSLSNACKPNMMKTGDFTLLLMSSTKPSIILNHEVKFLKPNFPVFPKDKHLLTSLDIEKCRLSVL